MHKHYHPRFPVFPFLPFILSAFLTFISCQGKIPTRVAEHEKITAFRDKLYDVTFTSKTEAWAVGYPGIIIHTIDAGRQWNLVDAGLDKALFAIGFSDRSHGWVVGQSGTVLATSDGGNSWGKQESGTQEHIFDVDFIDSKNGFAVGSFGTILSTKDGGLTWQSGIFEPMANASINALCFINPSTGWIAGEYPLWDVQLEEDVEESNIGNVFSTIDGGKTWNRQETGVIATLYDIYFQDGNKGWAAGSKGTFLYTEDGGITWKGLEPGIDAHLIAVDLIGDVLWAAGTNGALLKVENGTANELNTEVFTWLSGVAFGDRKNGIIVGGRGTLLYTEDGGRTWK